MLGAAVVYMGFLAALLGLAFVVRPTARFGFPTRRRALWAVGAGVALVVVGMALPAPEERVATIETRLDQFSPVWQFRERHVIRIAAPPSRVFEAIKAVRADEIAFFRTLTWIRRGGRSAPQSILNPGTHEPLLEVALRSGFVRLAEDAPRELVIGAVVIAPPGVKGKLTPEVFQRSLPPGFALAAMNFLVVPDGVNGSILSTETRVFATSPSARRRFAGYWRVIYPGSAIIRRMWLRAIERRATGGSAP